MDKVEQALLDRFVEVQTDNLTPAQVEQFFTGITLADVTIDYAVDDPTELRRRGTFMSESRNWRAREQLWEGSLITEVISPGMIWSGSLANYVNNLDSGKVYVDEIKGSVIFPVTVLDVYDLASIKTLLSAYTVYDFSDLGTVPDLIRTSFVASEDLPTYSQYPEITSRLEQMVRFDGGLLLGDLYFINDGKYRLDQVSLGKILTLQS